jgi:hypothetical protein
MVCLTLFCLANFLKALATKLLSTTFYRTAHFGKVKEALDKVRRAGRPGGARRRIAGGHKVRPLVLPPPPRI